MAQAIVIIPARYDSSRFPGKALADHTGRPLIRHVHDQATQAASAARVLVATDDNRIRAAVEAFGGEVVMTRSDHRNGTSRIAEVAEVLTADIIVNVQGDEPELDPALIDRAVETLVAHPECPVSTIASPFGAGENVNDPNVVKVVLDTAGCALYFSRASIPHDRDGTGDAVEPLKHVGLYAYRREFLPQYVAMDPTPLEQTERLEQLRILEHGYRIAVAVAESRHVGIDTPEQYEAFVARWAAAH